MKNHLPFNDNVQVNIYSDFGTPELRRHRGHVIVNSLHGIKKSYVRKISILNYYFANRKTINDIQYDAGNMVYKLYYNGVLSQFPKQIASYEAVRTFSSNKNNVDDKIMDYHNRYTKALNVLDKEEKKIIIHVCCEEKSLNKLYPKHFIPKAKKKFINALDKLAVHFGLSAG